MYNHDPEDPKCECVKCHPQEDIIARLVVAAGAASLDCNCSEILREAAQTIWNLRHGYGG